MTEIKAADLPEGSVVVDDDRYLVWFAQPRRNAWTGRWSVSDSPSYISDREIDAAMLYTARVLRYGYGVAEPRDAISDADFAQFNAAIRSCREEPSDTD